MTWFFEDGLHLDESANIIQVVCIARIILQLHKMHCNVLGERRFARSHIIDTQ